VPRAARGAPVLLTRHYGARRPRHREARAGAKRAVRSVTAATSVGAESDGMPQNPVRGGRRAATPRARTRPSRTPGRATRGSTRAAAARTAPSACARSGERGPVRLQWGEQRGLWASASTGAPAGTRAKARARSGPAEPGRSRVRRRSPVPTTGARPRRAAARGLVDEHPHGCEPRGV
jgi:hypothetical protein